MKGIDRNNPNRMRIIAMLQENPEISQAEVMRRTGLSRTATRWHIMNIKHDGLIERIELRGRPVKPAQKVSSEKLTEYAKQGRGTNAFVPRKTRKRDKLQERIDMVVAKAMGSGNSTQHDVIRHVNAPLRLTNSHKVG